MTTPYRFIHEVQLGPDATATATWTPTGCELGGDIASPTVPGFLVLEACAQCAGLLLSASDADRASRWLLGGIDDATLADGVVGVGITIDCRLIHRSSGSARVVVNAFRRDVAVARATLLMTRLSPRRG